MWWPMSRFDLDDRHGDTVVAFLEIKIRRNGAMSVGGSITDEMAAVAMLQTAIETVRGYHARQRIAGGDRIIVPCNETALVGTQREKDLLAARHELANVM
jgi:hypothetical protein